MENRTKKIVMLCVLLLGCVLTGLWSYVGEKNNDENTVNNLINISRAEKERQSSRSMKVYVSGAVLMPGIYDVSMGARAYDAVEAAGGMINAANADKVNLAKKLKDGDHVNVPFIKQSKGRSNKTTKVKDGFGNLADAANNTAGININTASESELDSLPGIGPAMARRIVDERERAPFSSVEDLLRVKGIGPAKLNKLRSRIRVN